MAWFHTFAVLISHHQTIWADLETLRTREARIKFAAACLSAHVALEAGCAECTYLTLAPEDFIENVSFL